MLADGTLALEKIAEYVGLSLDEVKNCNLGRTHKKTQCTIEAGNLTQVHRFEYD